jgi:hypothetical protein
MNNKEKPVTLEELAISNMWEIEALINVLDRKGLISKEELLEEVKKIKEEHDKKVN